jgi:hypothetical protein
VFGMIAGAHVAIVAQATGRVNIGDAGRLTYVRYVNGLPYPHWQGRDPATGVARHPSRQVHDWPPVYEFAAPVGGTYPIGHDPSYWYAGAAPGFDARGQAFALVASAQFYIDLFFRQQAGLALAALVLYGLNRRSRPVAGPGLAARWNLALPALAAFGLYGLVYVEGRYVAVFVVLLWADLLANLRWPAQPVMDRVAAWLSAGALAALLMSIVAFNLAGFSDYAAPPAASEAPVAPARAPAWPGETAEALHGLGIGPGDRVGVIGYAFNAFWARLARVQIVAEMLEAQADEFWTGDPALQSQVIAAFRRSGARAIVAERVPAHARLPGWQQLGETNHYIYLLEP